MLNIRFNDAASGKPYNLMEIGAHDAHEELLRQIAGKDRVHTFGAETVQDLREYRVANAGCTKTAYGIVGDNNKVESVIFGHKTAKPIRTGADLQGNVDIILKEKANKAFSGNPSAIVFFSISSFVRGSGLLLINALLANRQKDMIPATLSPLRTMREHHARFDGATLSNEEKTVLGFLHLLKCHDAVQNFHMGDNGAYIGDIKVDANTPDSKDGVDGMNLMVNYVYSDEIQRQKNKRLLHAINAHSEPRENMIRLVEPVLAERVLGLMNDGVMQEAYERDHLDRMCAILSAVKATGVHPMSLRPN